MKTSRCLLFVLFISSILSAASSYKCVSPDGRVEVTAALTQNKRLVFWVDFKDRPLIQQSNTGLVFKDMPEMISNWQVLDARKTEYTHTWQRLWGKRKNVMNHYRELILELQESEKPNRHLNMHFRVYNDGVALRYHIPKQSAIDSFSLTGDLTEFDLGFDCDVWAVSYGGYASHQESEFYKQRIADLDSETVYGLPMLIQHSDSVWLSIAEADLTDWAGMYLGRAGNDYSLRTLMAPLPGHDPVCVRSAAPRVSPWRVIMIGESAGDFIESDLIANLNDPCAIEHTDWIKPGKCAWDWWWCNRYAPDAEFELGSNTRTMQYFIDFSSEMSWPYQLVDWQWYGEPFQPTEDHPNAPNPDVNITRSTDQIDIPGLVEYAREKNVRLWLWLEWNHADRQMQEAFPLYEKWGIAGVKVDFMARDDQEMVNFYHRLVKKAAEHHLLVNFHGAYKPTGFSRTYPNLLTREGVLGNEYNKWSDRITPEHTLTLAYTRAMLGEMDFTPGGFVNVMPDSFVTENKAPSPMVMGTRCRQLAMMIVYESALQVLCDSPYNYRNSPAGLDVLRNVPTTWDDTKVPVSNVDDYIVVARRTGKDWYIGALTDGQARTVDIPLGFLQEDVSYSAQIWRDAPDADRFPQKLTKRTINVMKETVIQAEMAPAGGFVMHIQPEQVK
ncbi:MAG: glycoside hydrolase family 97 protein [candidate division KSB1 bacterium]|nr:glycoside hydrolase family 97 protein [candidate division KSB1 bacterium]